MTRQAIATSGAPAAIGPYSQAIAIDGLLFCSGQLGLDPATGDLVEGGVEAQAERSLRNLTAVLDAAGLVWVDVVKTTIFLADMADFAAVNAVYGRFMPDPPPARSTVQVAALPKGGLVEIEAIAVRGGRLTPCGDRAACRSPTRDDRRLTPSGEPPQNRALQMTNPASPSGAGAAAPPAVALSRTPRRLVQ